jgi:hypothetical protein
MLQRYRISTDRTDAQVSRDVVWRLAGGKP